MWSCFFLLRSLNCVLRKFVTSNDIKCENKYTYIVIATIINVIAHARNVMIYNRKQKKCLSGNNIDIRWRR